MIQSEIFRIKSKNTPIQIARKRKTLKYPRDNELSEKLIKILSVNLTDINKIGVSSSNHRSQSKLRKGSKKNTGKIPSLKKSEISKKIRKSINKRSLPFRQVLSSSESPRHTTALQKFEVPENSRDLLRHSLTPGIIYSQNNYKVDEKAQKNRFKKYDLLNIKKLATSQRFRKLIHEPSENFDQIFSEDLPGSSEIKENVHSKFGIDSFQKDVVKSLLLKKRLEDNERYNKSKDSKSES